MKNLIYVLLLTVFFSCENDKVVLLTEINHSEITEILDVSPGYLFYDETKTDSVELNRKNLISTTNWLINIDKRLTLKQVIPHIKYLQDKKANSSHKKEGVKNYFTCNDTSKKNLGFIDFTDVAYVTDEKGYIKDLKTAHANIVILNQKDIKIITSNNNIVQTTKETLAKTIKDLFQLEKTLLYLEFYDSLSFQDYITIKALMSKLNLENIEISNHEIIFN
ncbi:hypothetical protein FPF71_10120 [Algibacter amylolyticus]|uniref:Uncharacterized protein n=1 Tax=Algibacter amylolyticus TaxID=1608400 RepID=A0A5M7B526_9FLAO|nr:hypothetical protein [Algibacter amylolyticus]KAA5824522.1 hypothetical protein F2B50_10120 [Algibacter amylolyticus]MBB5269412.1 hypothetical protein [Algibacter amylolyticus]TSJ75295.1 hypothetical protein FPF71_10120 [Algibacter amylolyticus]